MEGPNAKEQRLSKCWRVHRKQENAEDAAQETAVKLHARPARKPSSADAYQSRVFRNALIDLWRRDVARSRHEQASARLRPEIERGQANLDINRVMEEIDVHEAVASLSPQSREVIQLFYFMQQSEETVATALGLTVAGVRSRIRRAIIRLRARLHAYAAN